MIQDSKHKKYLLIVLLISFLLFNSRYLLPHEALAVCPVCTVAVGAGLEISHLLGVDDSATSVWIGGLVLSTSYWLLDWMSKKKFKFLDKTNPKLVEYITIGLMYLSVLIPLWYGKYLGRLANSIMGIDKIVFGTVVGSAIFLLGKWADKKVREIKGKQLFVYQKVVFPISALTITSLVLYFITR